MTKIRENTADAEQLAQNALEAVMLVRREVVTDEGASHCCFLQDFSAKNGSGCYAGVTGNHKDTVCTVCWRLMYGELPDGSEPLD